MFNPDKFIEETIRELRNNYGDKGRILAAVSGGVDSTTAVALTYKALGEKVFPVIIDTGMLRKNEGNNVKRLLKGIMDVNVIDRSAEFYRRLEGIYDAEQKRKVFRKTFYETLSSIAREIGAKYLVQGTIAADWVETQGGIKTQHNVLTQIGLDPRREYGFSVIEPLADLYKNEVRIVAERLGLPKEIIFRQPFPGPGLLVRVPGSINVEKLNLCREVTGIIENEISGHSQTFGVVFENDAIPDDKLSSIVGYQVKRYRVKATGVKGDVRQYGSVVSISRGAPYPNIGYTARALFAYDITHALYTIRESNGRYAVVIRVVDTEDYMTADVPLLPIEQLESLARRIITIADVGEVMYDITSKPPATIEFE
ncbi:GMP synthase [Sulfolobales archaeon HS-7]|nr:GMP synthase [Sulfolobales archaeon HS-7]